jgi:hypothetical protein
MRELTEVGDCETIAKIIRDYYETATWLLYEVYLKNPEQEKENIKKYELEYILDTFKLLDESEKPPKEKSQFKEAIRQCSDAELFSPYGTIKAPFKEGAYAYVEQSIDERNEVERKIFRMGIEHNGKLIGCFAFGLIEQMIQGYRTIGNLGIFWEDTPMAEEYWKEAIYPAKYFIDQVLGYENKSDDLYISVRVHLCNHLILPLVTPKQGFKDITNFFSYRAAGKRKIFIAPYSDFIYKFFPVKGQPYLKITNDSDGVVTVYA